MRAMLFLIVLIGVGIGAMMPVSPTRAPGAAPSTAPTGAASPVVQPVTPSDTPTETVLHRDGSGHFFAFGDVNGETIRFVIDTGADFVALTEEDAERAHVDFNPAQFTVVGKGASGDVRGQHVTLDNVVLDGKRIPDVRGAVIEGLDVSLLGQSYLARIGSITMTGDEMRLK